MIKEKKYSKSPLSKSKRFFKGVKTLLLSNNKKKYKGNALNEPQQQQQDTGIDVTLTKDLNPQEQQQSITVLDQNLNFSPSQPAPILLPFQEKAFVHYEPSKAQITIGTTNSKIKRLKLSMVLNVEQYAWLIQQLKEEQNIFRFLNHQLSTMLGVHTTNYSSNSFLLDHSSLTIGKRLLRFVQLGQRTRKRNNQQLSHHNQYFILPKSLLLQAATYIPVAKPLPPIDNDFLLQQMQKMLESKSQFEEISDQLHIKLKRYCRFVSLCFHELVSEQYAPSVIQTKKNPVEFTQIKCSDCHLFTGLETICSQQDTDHLDVLTSTISQRLNTIMKTMNQPIMFPISIDRTNSNNKLSIYQSDNINDQQVEQEHIFMSSAVQPTTKNNLFDSFRKQKPHAFSAFQYIPPERTVDDTSSISECSEIEEEEEGEEEEEEEVEEEQEIEVENHIPERHGYVAVDNENEEILVVFPSLAYDKDEPFKSVPWLEIETITSIPPISERNSKKQESEQDLSPWVLESALLAWNRCEMKVVTLLMRLCTTLPSHYKVVIVGHSLGGAVAALCASSLRSTKLLLNRAITVCAIHPPRVGNKSFLNTLSYQRVDTIRITHPKDHMAHSPPRTSGLLHLGDTTIILPFDNQHKGYTLQQQFEEEDTLDRIFNFKEYDVSTHTMAWEIHLDDQQCI